MAKSNFTNIKGDASVIAAAGLEARSNTQVDVSKTVSGFVESYGELMQAFSDNAEKQTELLMGTYGDIKKTLPKLKDELEKLEGQGMGGDFEAEIQGLRDELAAIPVGFKHKGKRQELLNKINKRIAGVQKEGEKINSVIEKFDSNLVDPNMGDQELYSLIQNAVKYTAGDKENVDESFKISSEDGQTYFSMTIDGKEVKKSISEVDEQLDGSIPDASAIIAANEVLVTGQDAAKGHANNPKLTFEDIRADLVGRFVDIFNDYKNPKSYGSIINQRLNGQERSLVKDLATEGSDISKNIYEALEKLYPEADTDGKKGISAKEAQAYLNVNNYEAFVNEIKNPSAENKQKIYKIVANSLADNEAKKAYDYGINLNFKQKEKNKENEKAGSIFDPNSFAYFTPTINGKTRSFSKKGTVLEQDRQKVVDIVLNNKGDKFYGAYGDYTWNPKENIWTVGDEEISTFDLMNKEEIFAPGQAFENSLFEEEEKKTYSERFKVEDYSDMEGGVSNLFNAINTAFDNKNKKTKGADLKIRRGGLGGNTITLIGPDGNEIKFKFNNTGGFKLQSRNEKTKKEGQLILEDLIKTVNQYLGIKSDLPTNTDD